MSTIRRLLKIFGFFTEYTQDLWVFIRHNGHSPLVEKNRRLFYSTIIQTHTIEKGLALAKPRPLFGREKISELFSKLENYDPSYSSFPVNMANGALFDYRAFNTELKQNDPVLEKIDHYLGTGDTKVEHHTGGVKTLSSSARLIDTTHAISFLVSRTSCRMFNSDALPLNQIEQAVKIAQSAPSQCNRQASKAHFFQNKALIGELLELQGGSRGFSDRIGNLFIITSEISAWGGPQQRNQLYVDGALFSQYLMLAFHSLNLASCPLNLAVTNKREQQIKRVGGISDNERVIMMLAVGKTEAEGVKAAKSPRRKTSEILTVH